MLDNGWAKGRSISVGLEVDPSRLPEPFASMDVVKGVVEFNRMLIEATADLAVAYKPQSAVYEAMGTDGVIALIETVDAVRSIAPETPIILDAKRGDIGSTNDKYVDTVFDLFGADAVTVSPYLGPEAMTPFLDRGEKGVIVLCRTSNPGSGRYQDLLVDGEPLYQHVARSIATEWNYNGNCGLVVGATYPEELRKVREIVGRMPILIPGVGAQGGNVEAMTKAGADDRGAGMIIHASRSLMYAFEKHGDVSPQEATRIEIEKLDAEIRSALAG